MKTIEINLPPSIENLERPLKSFFEAMVYKLHKNAHKGRWEHIGIGDAFQGMAGESEELNEAIGRRSNIEIVLEAADVANFAMIIANIAMKEGS